MSLVQFFAPFDVRSFQSLSINLKVKSWNSILLKKQSNLKFTNRDFSPSLRNRSLLSSFARKSTNINSRGKGSRVGPTSFTPRTSKAKRYASLSGGEMERIAPVRWTLFGPWITAAAPASAFIFARLVASCTEITPPPLCPTVPSPRARTPTECPISKGCTLHLVLPSFSFRFGNDAPPGLRAHLSQPGCSADESRCWRNWDKRQVSRDRCCVFEKSSCSSNLSQQSKDSRIIRFCPSRYTHKYAISICWFVWLLEKMLEGEDRKVLDRTLNWYREDIEKI